MGRTVRGSVEGSGLPGGLGWGGGQHLETAWSWNGSDRDLGTFLEAEDHPETCTSHLVLCITGRARALGTPGRPCLAILLRKTAQPGTSGPPQGP